MKRNVLTQYLIITASCALYAVGFNWMFDPNHISVGGFTGLGQIINYLLPGLPIGTIVIILNVPLFVLGWRFIGKDFLFSSVYATAVSSLMIDGLAAVHTFKPMEPILACLYGGVIIGVSCGIMLREGATTGGTELAARLLKLKLESLPVSCHRHSGDGDVRPDLPGSDPCAVWHDLPVSDLRVHRQGGLRPQCRQGGLYHQRLP